MNDIDLTKFTCETYALPMIVTKEVAENNPESVIGLLKCDECGNYCEINPCSLCDVDE